MISSQTISPTSKFIENSQPILNTLNIKTKQFEEITSHLQYMIVAHKQSQKPSTPILILTRISKIICCLMRIE